MNEATCNAATECSFSSSTMTSEDEIALLKAELATTKAALEKMTKKYDRLEMENRWRR